MRLIILLLLCGAIYTQTCPDTASEDFWRVSYDITGGTIYFEHIGDNSGYYVFSSVNFSSDDLSIGIHSNGGTSSLTMYPSPDILGFQSNGDADIIGNTIDCLNQGEYYIGVGYQGSNIRSFNVSATNSSGCTGLYQGSGFNGGVNFDFCSNAFSITSGATCASYSCYPCDCSCTTNCYGPGAGQCCDPSCASCYGALDSTCVSCNTGYYMDSNQTCQACNVACATCTGSGPSACLSCKSGYYMDSTQTCQSCNVACATCTSSGPNACPSCNSGYYPQPSSTSCLTTCPSVGYYSDSTNHTCQPCDESCYTCNGVTANNCTSCKIGGSTYLYNSMCTSCPAIGYYPNTTTQICDTCDGSCYTCNRGTANNCTSCKTGGSTYLYSSMCTSCPAIGYYTNTTTQICDTCDESCYTCTAGQPGNCTSTLAAANFAQGTGSATQTAGTVMTTAVLVQSVMSIGSTSAVRVAFAMQLLHYYRYINVNYPTIVLVLFNSTLEEVVFDIKPSSSSSSFTKELDAFKSETVEPPGKFFYYGNSAYFIDNCGDTALTLLLVLCLCGILKYVIYLLRNSKRQKIKDYLILGYSLVHWNLFFTLLLSNHQPIVLFSFLQMTSPDYHTAYGILCIILLSIFVVIAAATPLVILIVNERYFKSQKQKPTPNKVESSEPAGDEKITLNKLEENSPEILQNQEAIPTHQIALSESQHGDLLAKNNHKDSRQSDNVEDESPKIQDVRQINFRTQERSINLEENSPVKLLKDRKVDEEGHQNDEYITAGEKNQLKDHQSEAVSPSNDRSNNFGAKNKQSEDPLQNVAVSLEVENKASDDQISKENKKEEKTNQKKEDLSGNLTSYKVFFKEFKSVSRLHLIFLVIYMMRGAIFVGALAFGQGNGLGQAIVIMIINIVFLIYFIIVRPYGQFKQNIVIIANELVLLAVSIIIVAIGAHTNTSNPDQGTVYNLGLGIVACNFCLMLINLISSVLEVLAILVTGIIAARKYFRERREKKSKQKDLNQEKDIELITETNKPPNPALVMTQLEKQLSKSSITKDKAPQQKGYYFERVETDIAQKLNLSTKPILQPPHSKSIN